MSGGVLIRSVKSLALILAVIGSLQTKTTVTVAITNARLNLPSSKTPNGPSKPLEMAATEGGGGPPTAGGKEGGGAAESSVDKELRLLRKQDADREKQNEIDKLKRKLKTGAGNEDESEGAESGDAASLEKL